METIKHISQVVQVERPDNKLYQYVLHQEELSALAAKSLEGWQGSVQVKYDGVFFALVVREGKPTYAFSRTGKRFTNVEFIENIVTVETSIDHSGVYFGELVCPAMTLEALSGAVNPNRTKALGYSLEDLGAHVRLFDSVSLEEFTEGYSESSHYFRMARCVRFKTYIRVLYEGITLAETYWVTSKEALDKYTERALSAGEEGIVYRPDHEGWLAGHKGFRCTKKVRTISFDLECIGTMIGQTGKRKGVVTNLLFRWKGGSLLKADLGKGWTEEDRVALAKEPEEAIGKIFKVYGLQVSSKGKIRLCKVGEARIDKTQADY